MRLHLDFRSGIPIYAQLVEQIESKIAAGDLHVGDQLPTVRQLAEQLRVNFNTVARAYRMLDEAGLISTQQGRGTYILDKPSPEIERSLRIQTLIGLTHRYLEETGHLGCSAEDVQAVFQEQFQAWVQGVSPPVAHNPEPLNGDPDDEGMAFV